jgi:uncharacterized cupredoxin-like copper-binding protein
MRPQFLFASIVTGLMASSLALAAPGHKPGEGHSHGPEDSAYGVPGDPKQAARIVQITMTEADGKMLFIPDKVEVRRGEQIRFMLRNNGGQPHEFVLGTLEENLKHGEEMKKNPDMEHEDPNAKRLDSKKTGEIVWKFTKTGEFDFSCLIPGHRESGMFGKVIVK